MKLTVLILIGVIMQVSATTFAQKITLNKKNASLDQIIKDVRIQSGYDFFYDNTLIRKSKPVTIQVTDASLEDVLNKCFADQPFTYQVSDKAVTIKEKEKSFFEKVIEAIKAIDIKGRILDENGGPLPGASVRVKGTKKVAVTGSEGQFVINDVDENATIEITFVGYQILTVTANQDLNNLRLVKDESKLDEVIVTAYGRQQSKLSNVAAISTIKNAEIKQSPAASISVALAGRLPGLTAMQRVGEPGRENNILLIRGKGTFNTQSPLIVVDGVERSDFLNNLDPNEVESISILKDASSTALYGVRGANGVIIVTTKRGNSDAPEINFSAEYSLQNYTSFPERLNALDYATLVNEARKNVGQPVKYTEAELEHWRLKDFSEAYPDIDWLKESTKSYSPQNRYNLNLSGGSPKVRYFINAGYLGQDGLWKTDQEKWNANTTLDRYNFRSNFDTDLSSTLKASLQLGGYIEKQNRPVGLFGEGTNVIINAILKTPAGLFNKLTPEGEVLSVSDNPGDAPVYGLINRTGYIIESRNNVTGTFAMEQDLSMVTKGWSIKGLFAFDSRAVNTQTRSRDFARYRPVINDNTVTYELYQGSNTNLGAASLSSSFVSNSTLQFSTSYARTFGAHETTGLLLFQRESKLINADLPYNYQSLASRFTYGYNRKYLAEVNLGYNGSEQFAKGKRYGFFPAFAAGWVISEEDWAKDLYAVQNLKLRSSYGIVGNDRMSSSRFLYLDDFGKGGSGWADLGPGTIEKFIGNYNISWERAKKFNIGIDAKLFNTLSLTADYFREKRSNILTRPGKVPDLYGNVGALPAINVGIVENNGFEVELGYNKVFNNEMSFMLRGNAAYSRNKVINKDEPIRDETWATRYPSTGMMIGQPVGLVTAGYFNSAADIETWPNQSALGQASQPGDLKYVDQNGDGIIDVKDEVPIGYPNEPLLNFGLAFSYTYKNFDLGGLFQGSALKSLFISGQGAYSSQNLNLERYLGRWNQERFDSGQPITYPRVSQTPNANERLNTFFLEDASFIRLKTVELGYTLPKGISKRLGGNVRFFFTGLNLFTWDKLSTNDFDPEYVPGLAISHPLFKVYNFGVNAKF